MNPALEKLLKFFKLEAERGYDNKAVVGGLDKMLETWSREAAAAGLESSVVEVVSTRLASYPALSPKSREETLRGIWRRVQSMGQTAHRPAAESTVAAQTSPPAAAPRVEKARPELASRQELDDPAIPAPPSIAAGLVAALEPPLVTGGESAESARSAEHKSGLDFEIVEPLERPALRAPERPDRSRREARPRPLPPDQPAALDAPLTVLHGVGPRSAVKLESLGLRNLGDMLYYFPRRYDDYSRLKPINRLTYGDEVTIIGTVEDVRVRSIRRGAAKLVEGLVGDGTGSLGITWFNQPWVANKFRPGAQVKLAGRVDQHLGRLRMNSPEWEILEPDEIASGRIQPVYPLTAGVNGKWLRRLMESVIRYWARRVVDPLPDSIRQSADQLDLPTAIQQAHFPDHWDLLREAQQRLAFDELFLLQLGVLAQKREWQSVPGIPVAITDDWLARFVSALPFRLTGAQEKALADVRADLASGRPMNRLLQGDVGSGKTAVAAAALAMVLQAGSQGAMMAPTSILAEQHFRTLTALLTSGTMPAGLVPEDLRLLLGATPEREKAEIREGLASGRVKIVIGTHALIESPVEFASLGLAVIDEQHRFGVTQRAALRSKGANANPHLLVMTATPIPRSLALTLYGDLDLTVMDEMPPGRPAIETRTLRPVERERAYAFIRTQVEQGRQAFIIYPLVEESEKLDARAAVAEYERLQRSVFPEFELGLIHGRLSQDEKEAVMADFNAGQTRILVSTSVVEVGLDVPNATVMLVEGANRFGLSQLHQFRGRVGRGQHKSYCLLISDVPGGELDPRLRAMQETSDGFLLAERDLQQRGPGDFLGTRQSGFADLNMARLTDVRLIEKARREAIALFERDPHLERPEHRGLALQMQTFWSADGGDLS